MPGAEDCRVRGPRPPPRARAYEVRLRPKEAADGAAAAPATTLEADLVVWTAGARVSPVARCAREHDAAPRKG